MPVYRGPGGAGDATNDATVTAVQAAATSAATSATNAANSATAAATSASGAATSATNAANSATTAAGSVTTAAGHASSASTYATNSALSADDSADYALESQTYASQAFDSATEASSSASAASTSATNAGTSATNASNSAASALAIYGNTTAMNAAVASATASASSASTSASTATTQASNAASSASTATTQAGLASTSATNANNSAVAASLDANEAQAAAIAAKSAVNNAEAIYGSLADIQQAEANSEANRDAAAASATSASNSASTATTQAGIATTQANNAAVSAAAASAVALGNEPVRHSVRPSLLLDFANTKQLDPRITFTRASTGTYYDGKTTVKAEENLILQSQDFATAWTTSNLTVTANTTTAPDGTTTADSIIPTTAASTSHRVIQSVTLTATPSVFSIYVKANGYTKVGIREVSVAGYYASFNLTAVTVLDSSLCTGSIVDAGNGWYRVTLSFTGVAGVNIWSIYPLDAAYTTGSPTAYTFTADGTSGLFVWGAQLEQRSSVTAYTATTTAPITNYIPALQTAASGVARFEHDPVTRESLGLEIEEQRTNLVTYSEDFSNAAWIKGSTVIQSNAIVAPDGTLTGEKMVANTSSAAYNLYQSITATAIPYTFVFYAKAGEYGYAVSRMEGGNPTIFNLLNGTISLTGTGYTASITSVGNGWYRCAVTKTATAGAWYAVIGVTNNSSSETVTGNGFSGIYIWGAQLEAGAFATSYIPTVASQVTRSADSASMTGTNFSSWYRADEGTLYAESLAGTWGRPVAFISEGVGNNYIRIQSSDTNAFVFNVMTNSATVVQMNTGVALAGKSALAFKANDFAGSANANTVTTDTAGALPIVSQLNIGSSITGSTNYLNGTVKKLAYYSKKLTNAELQGVTTV